MVIDGPREDVDDRLHLHWTDGSHLSRIDPPTGPTLHIDAHDANGRVTAIRLGAGTPYQLRYDARSDVASIEHQSGTIRFERDAEGRLSGYTDLDGHSLRLEYDEAGRAVAAKDDFGHRTTWLHDTESRELARSTFGINGQLVHSLEAVFDVAGRLQRQAERKRVSDSGELVGRTTRMEHDAAGHLVGVVDDESGARVGIDVDLLGRLATITQPSGASISHHYDAIGQRAGVIDAIGNRVTEYRDDFGQVVGAINPDTGIERLERDVAGNVIGRYREDSGLTRYQRDAGGQLIERTGADASVTSWTYDPDNGRLSETSTQSTRERYHYDLNAHLIKHERWIDGHRFVTSYVRDARGRIVEKTLPDAQVLHYSYHTDGAARGTLQGIERRGFLGVANTPLLSEIDLERRDGRGGWTAHNGLRTQIAYEADGTAKRIETDDMLALALSRDFHGRIDQLTLDGQMNDYRYADNRLVQAEQPEATYTYGYDAAGNRRASSVRSASGDVHATQYRVAVEVDGAGNRLVERIDTVSGLVTEWQYDAGGMPLSVGTLAYGYDIERRPVRVSRDGALLAEYTYNAAGERVKKRVFSASGEARTTYFLYDDRQLAAEADVDGEVHTQYLYVEDYRPVVKLEGEALFAIHTDHLGTPRRMSDAEGEQVWSASYTPFGEATVTLEQHALPLRFAGQYFDEETGTHYNYLRDYDPDAGRYLTSDPIGLPGGLNGYAYVSGNPLNRIDPMGLFELPPPGTALHARLVQLGIIAAAEPTPVGEVAFVVYLTYLSLAGISSQVDEGPMAPPESGDFDFIVNEVQAYDPDYSPPSDLSSWEQYRALSDRLYQEQLDYYAQHAGAPVCDPLVDRARAAIELRDMLNSSMSGSDQSLIEEIVRLQYEDFRANGGDLRLSLEDWVAAGMPDGPSSETQLPGRWKDVNESMSDRARRYQLQITGREGQAFEVNGVHFDGVNDSHYLEAKGPGYASFVRNGVFLPFFEGRDRLANQARNQSAAANGKPIVWHVAEEAASAMRDLLRLESITGIEIVHTPAN